MNEITYGESVTMPSSVCEEHGVAWNQAEQRLQGGPARRDIVGHVRIEYSASGGIWVYWHPVSFVPSIRNMKAV